MTTTKSIMSMTGIAFAVMFGGGVYFLSHMNDFAKDYIEKVGTQTLGVPVQIDSLEVDLKNQRARVKNLQIRNAVGFHSPNSLIAERIDIELASLSKTLIEFKVIEVQGAQAWMDLTPLGTNFQVIQKNAKAAPKAKDSKKVIIDTLSLRGLGLHTSLVAAGEVEALDSVELPHISLKAIGERENGVVAGDAVAQIWTSLAAQFATEAPKKAFFKDIKEKGTEKLKNLFQ